MASHLINITPTKQLNYLTPHEHLFHKPPDYTHVETFGCLFYMIQVSIPEDNLAPRGIPCVFIEYPYRKKGYQVMDIHIEKCYNSKDMYFIKDVYPFFHYKVHQTLIYSQVVQLCLMILIYQSLLHLLNHHKLSRTLLFMSLILQL